MSASKGIAAETPSTWVCTCGSVNPKGWPCGKGC